MTSLSSNDRAVDRVPSDLKAPVFNTFIGHREVEIEANPYDTLRGHVTRISGEEFDVTSSSSPLVATVLWSDLRAARTVSA